MTRLDTNKASAAGFTLVELLTVVAIIGLLVGMVVPTIRAIVESQKRLQASVRIRSLDDGCGIYRMEKTGNRYYPGQSPEAIAALGGGGGSALYPNCQNAGSILLARCLFTDANGLFPTSAYGQYTPGMLGSVPNVGGTDGTILNFNSDPMAILYFPSRPGQKGNVNQFVKADNSRYVDHPSANRAKNSVTNATYTIQTYAKGTDDTTGSSTIIRNDGRFIITTAGPSGLYYGTDAIDNFNK